MVNETARTASIRLHPSRPLGEFAAIHGISEETLHSHGRDPADVFREFARFYEDAVLVGHNVAFDLSMIRALADFKPVPGLRAENWLD